MTVNMLPESREVAFVETKYRKICTAIPAPESIAMLKELRSREPQSMGGQPAIFWDRAEGIAVYDKWGNKWLDWSSGVLVTSAGHNHPKIKRAMLNQINYGLVHNYCFPSEIRSKLAAKLIEVAPDGLDKVFLLTTGSEATECAIKLARTKGERIGGNEKIVIVTFDSAFHGRTMGAQMAGGIPALKEWIVNVDPAMVQVPYPDGFRCSDVSFDLFEKTLKAAGVKAENVAGVMTETYPGGSAQFMPIEYAQALRKWCDKHDALLIMDEVQAGFGRTGKYWGFEHYGLVPDLICCGKGISSGMPLSCVIGANDVMDLYPPGSMTSTHTGNPVCAAAGLANLEVIEEEGLVENSAKMGAILLDELKRIGAKYGEYFGMIDGKGLVAAMQVIVPGGTEPNNGLAKLIVRGCIEKGLMLFNPVGFGGGSVKISPPLCITEEALLEGVSVLEESIDEVMAELKK